MKSTVQDRINWVMGDDTVQSLVKKMTASGYKVTRNTVYVWKRDGDMPESALKVFCKIYNVDPAFIRYGGKSGDGDALKIPHLSENKYKAQDLASAILDLPEDTRDLLARILTNDELKPGPTRIIKTKDYEGPERREDFDNDRRHKGNGRHKQEILPFYKSRTQ